MCPKGMNTMSGVRSPTTMIVSVVFLWAVCWVSTSSCSGELGSDVVKTVGELQFQDDGISTFSSSAAPAPKSSGDTISLANGDFELTNITAMTTTLADSTSTSIPNWIAGGAGVQILVNTNYSMAKGTPSVYCIHLNNPDAIINGTQGTISTTLAANAETGKTYTVHYDVARMPDAPMNLWPALKVSNIQGGTVREYAIKQPVYNMTDSRSQITWTKQSFVYTGTGVSTVIKFESMSEKYGPMIDNVETLSGKHELAAAPPSKISGLSQKLVPLFTLVALAMSHCSPAFSTTIAT
ncbi:uncharacterized protein [Physcomitrium patens]|uniref:DUF642 domain-containing protein n=1 Tax=Physcomitrium patens TaxID=3218 RepID=A0A2K1L213_PHYPA|nr:uncharacterized protein LOC112276943 [Physcomitrium patens]XP_024364554.1 uncharacterized protein LOC112276943 [Physcomitrium patens]XP_024364564.1 uncharacterized protein LOC112276943 [Physcomitrium patens]PNR60077.1 hypothetical protein PHYPA_002870 [Physcomitrium patens]|eukprot:XP_024364545.1 uncharacterized protein LOC112276943 [Physcomitrella patens]